MKAVGIVLAGGRSRRFGADKLTAMVGDRPLLDLAVGAVAAVTPQVIVALAPGDERPIATPDGASIRVVHDPEPDGGPLVGLATALETALGDGADRVIVVGGDMPTIQPSVLRALIDRLDAPSIDAAVAIVGGRPRPLPCALRSRVAVAAARASLGSSDRSLRAFLARLRVAELDESSWRPLDPAGQTFRDVDVPGDLPS